MSESGLSYYQAISKDQTIYYAKLPRSRSITLLRSFRTLTLCCGFREIANVP